MRKQLLSYSMHIDFVIPVNGNLNAVLESYKHKAEKAAMDYGFHMAITKWNDEVSREMEVMVKEHGGCILSSAFLDYSVHDEHPRCQIFSSFLQLEGEATSREIRLAKFVNTTLYVVHVMSTDAMEEIAKAKREGMVPGHLVQTSSSSMQIKTELFYEHLLSEHWLVSALYKKNQDWVGPRITCWGFRTKWSHGIDNTPNLSTKLI